MRKHPILKPLDHYISIEQTCDQRQLPQDQGSYWNFRKGLYADQDIKDKGSRPVTSELGCPVLRSKKDLSYSYSYSSRKQFMEYSTLHFSRDLPYQERGSAVERTLCKVSSMPNVPTVLKHQAMHVCFRCKFNGEFSGDGGRSFVMFQP